MPTSRDSMGNNMNNHEQPEPRTPQLGATHEANVRGEFRISPDQLPVDVAQQWLEKHPEGLPPIIGGESGLRRPVKEREILRDWRAANIKLGQDHLKKWLAWGEKQLRDGVSPSYPQAFEISRGASKDHLDASLTEFLTEIRLALAVYQTPEEAARGLRHEKRAVEARLTEFHHAEAKAPLAHKPYLDVADSRKHLTQRQFVDHFEQIAELIENPPEVQEFRRWLDDMEKAFGEKYTQRIAERVKNHQLVALMPDEEDVPLHVPLEHALTLLRGRIPPELDTEDEAAVQAFLKEEMKKKRAEMEKQMGLALTQETSLSGETSLIAYQKDFNRFLDALETFPPDEQDAIVMNFIFDGTILGGQFASFYKNAIGQYGPGPTRWGHWLDNIAFVQKVQQIKGYVPPDAIFNALGSAGQETVALPNYHVSHEEVWLEGEKEPRRFSLSTRELIGHMARLDTMVRLGVNSAYDKKTGFDKVKVTEFVVYCMRKMGYSLDHARKMADGDMAMPKLARASRLSPVRRKEMVSLDEWIGEVALGKLVVSSAWIKWGRITEEYGVLDFPRREILSLRGLELAHYSLVYALGLPPEQFLAMIALFGSVVSLDHKLMLEWVSAKMGDEQLGGKDAAAIRSQLWNEMITINRPNLASSRDLAKMAMGLDEFNQTGDKYLTALHQGMEDLPPAHVEALRHPDTWKYKWFKNADQDSSQWSYIGHLVGGPSLDQARRAFEGYDFSEELGDCGLSEREIRDLRQAKKTQGFDGWKTLLANATMGLLDWEKVKNTSGDKNPRYWEKKKKGKEAALAFLETSLVDIPRAGVTHPTQDLGHNIVAPSYSELVVANATDKDFVIQRAKNNAGQIQEAIEKLLPQLSEHLDFIPNETQAAFIEAVFQMYLQGHAAHALDVYVEDIEVVEKKKGKVRDKLSGGTNWSVRLLRKEDIDQSRIQALLSEGYYFQQMPGEGDEGKAYLISPLCAPLPKLVEAKALIGTLEQYISEGKDALLIAPRKKGQKRRIAHIKKAVEHMKVQRAFCFEWLINGRSDIPPAVLVRALNHLKDEGPMTAASREAMANAALEFQARFHPEKTDHITFEGKMNDADCRVITSKLY